MWEEIVIVCDTNTASSGDSQATSDSSKNWIYSKKYFETDQNVQKTELTLGKLSIKFLVVEVVNIAECNC